MSIFEHPARPIRAIHVRGIFGDWQASYAGDNWRPAFRTEWSSLPSVLREVEFSNVRRGLPIIVHTEDWEVAI